MKILVIGATGYIGSAVAEKLQERGFQVVGLARSDTSAAALESRGIEFVRGDLNSPESLAAAVRSTDGVIYAAFSEGYDFLAAVETEQRAVGAIINALRGSGKPLIFTSGTAVLGDTGDRIFDEETPINRQASDQQGHQEKESLKALGERLKTETEVLTASGIHGIVLRPPNVYGRSNGKSLLTLLKAAGRSLGAVPYAVGTADHQWSFVHIEDLADLYLLALNKANGGELFHAGAESGLRTKAIAEALSRGIGLGGKTVELSIPELGEALGIPPLAPYWASNSQSSSEKARRLLGWRPENEQLLKEIAEQSEQSG